MKIADLIRWFENWANPAWQEKWDNCGWQIEPGILDQPARVLVCLTPTLAVMEEAIATHPESTTHKESPLDFEIAPINLIFAHHPLIFSPLKSVCQGHPIGDMVQKAIAHGIGVYSAHTNFDQVADGTADVLAQCLNLQQPEPVEPTQNGLGYGRVGNLETPLTLEKLLNQIQTTLRPPRLLVSPQVNPQQLIQRVAVLGGSGASYIEAVSKTGAQVYLTSDCKFHQFQESRDRSLILVDAGHYATERPACAVLQQKFRDIGVEFVKLSDRDEDFRQFWFSQGTT